MDVSGISKGNCINIPYTEENIFNNKDNTIKESQGIEVANKDYNKNDNKEYDKKDLDKALKKINKFLEDEPVHAEYSMHKDLKRLMIKIVDDNTKNVILEIPCQKILDMVASMCKQVGLIDKKA